MALPARGGSLRRPGLRPFRSTGPSFAEPADLVDQLERLGPSQPTIQQKSEHELHVGPVSGGHITAIKPIPDRVQPQENLVAPKFCHGAWSHSL